MRSWASLAILLAATIPELSRPVSGQQLPVIAPHGSKGFSAFRAGDLFVLFSVKARRLSVVPAPGSRSSEATEVTFFLPPRATRRDEGAINAAIEIVVARNLKLSTVLARAALRTSPANSDPRPIPGELYLRIYKPASASGHRLDMPSDPFAASPMRTVSNPQFPSRNER